MLSVKIALKEFKKNFPHLILQILVVALTLTVLSILLFYIILIPTNYNDMLSSKSRFTLQSENFFEILDQKIKNKEIVATGVLDNSDKIKFIGKQEISLADLNGAVVLDADFSSEFFQQVQGIEFVIGKFETGGTKNIFENKTIVGVLNDKISELEIYGGEFLPTIIMTNACVPAETGSQNFLFCSVYLDSYFNRDSAISEINQIFSSEEMSVLSTSSDTMVAIESQKKIMLAVLTTACALIIIALFLSYIIELLGSAKKQEGHFNVMFSCGITQKKLWLIVFVEELIVSVVSLILAFGLSAALLTVIYKIVESTSGVALATNFGILLPMLGIATGGIVVLSILTSLIPLLVFRKK